MASADRFVLVSFTDDAAASDSMAAGEAKDAAQAGEPAPAGSGGTAYLPVAESALARMVDERPAHLILITDGMAPDIAGFAAAVGGAGLPTTLVPFGEDWPFVKAQWEHAERIRLAAHVSDQPLGIARALAHAMLELTRQAPQPPRRGVRLRRRLARRSAALPS